MSYILKVFKGIRGFLKRDDPKGNSQSGQVSADASKATLISPSYDPLTTWLSFLVSSVCRGRRLMEMMGDDASHIKLQEFFSENRERKAKCIIFAGHGKADFLLTAPTLGDRAEEFTGRHSVLMSRDTIGEDRGLAIFAYACEAGLGLGSHARSLGVFFLGYEDEIPFVPNEDDTGFDPIFCEPVKIALDDYDKRGILDSHTAELIQNFYRSSIVDFRSKRRDPRCRSVEWALRLHLELISS